MLEVYVLTKEKNYAILNTDIHSLRNRQRNINMDGSKVNTFNFVSYKKMIKQNKLKDKYIYNNIKYYTISKL